MIHANDQLSLMYQEAQTAPNQVAMQLAINKTLVETLAAQLRLHPPSLVMTCAHGSSDHAATYAQYLVETHMGIPVMSSPPSIFSIFATQEKMDHVLFLAISQSGQSPDILAATQAAKKSGAHVVSLVNDTNSPLAELSNAVIPLHAGIEKSVAATKSFICSLSALVHLVAAWKENHELMAALFSLSSVLESAFDKDWPHGLETLKPATSLFVVSRGLGLGVAQEAALKLKETCALHAEAFSAAEVKHGPMTIARNGFPVLLFSVQDQTQRSIDDAALALMHQKAQILSAGTIYDKAINLSLPSCALAPLRPLVFIQSFYKFVNALSIMRGYNPDEPPFLNKITETL